MRRMLVVLATLLVAGCASKSNHPETIPPPSRPSNVAASAGGTSVKIGWTPVSGATSYHVYGSTLAGVSRTSYEFTVSSSLPVVMCFGLTKGVLYHFVVTASGPGGESGESVEVTATPKGGDTSPVTVTAYPTAPGTEELVGRFECPTGYSVTAQFEYGTTIALGSVTSPEVHSTPGDVQVSANLPGLPEGTTHYYRLRTEDADGVYTGTTETFKTLVTPAELVSNLDLPSALQVSGGYVYWIDLHGAQRAPATGGPASTIGSVVMLGVNGGLAIDGTDAFWSDGTTIWTTPMSGGTATPLAGSREHVTGVSRWSTYVYWREDAGLMRMPAAGGTIDTLKTGVSAGPMRVDATGIWYADWDRGVIELRSHAGAVATLVTDVHPYDLVHESSSGLVLWTDGTGLYRMSEGGGALTKLGNQASYLGHLVKDGSHVYWANAPSSVSDTHYLTGATQPIAVQQYGCYSCAAIELAVDASYVYWIVPGSSTSPPAGTILRAPR